MEIFGYAAALLIGISLGLIGGGGSILTVPVLVYLFGIDAVAATVYSLFIVGATSAVGSVSYFRKDLVSLRTALLFGLPSVAAVYVARNYLVPALPAKILRIGDFSVSKSAFLLVVFAVLMLLASWSMIRKKATPETDTRTPGAKSRWLLPGLGLLVGLITGFVGAGGGFLIIPALVSLLGMPMKKAVGTSLLIIALNSLLGFAFSLGTLHVPWPFLLSLLGLAIAGTLLGSALSNQIDGRRLKPAFGWFVLAMGLFILLRETVFA